MHLVEHRVTVPGEHEILGLRELSDQDAADIKAADELIRRVASAHWFRRLRGLTNLSLNRIQLVEAHDQPHPNEIAACRAAVAAVVEAQARLSSDLVELLRAYAPEDRQAATLASLDAVASSDSWSWLTKLSSPGAQLAFDRQPKLGILDQTGGFRVLAPLVEVALTDIESAVSETLLALADEVLAAAKLLRTLHVECPQGLPALLDIGPIAADAQTAEGLSIIPQDLSLGAISEALRLVRTAEKLAEREEETAIAHFTVREGETEDEAAACEQDSDRQSKVAVDGVNAQPAAADDVQAVAEDEKAGDVEVPPASAVVDLRGLIYEAQRLNGVLEEAWSLALNRALTHEGVERQMAALRASIASMQRSFEGDPVRLEEFPPGPELLEELERDPQRVRERIVSAQLLAFTQVVDKLAALSQPSRVQVQIREGQAEELTRFWESGAFAQLRLSLELLGELLEDSPQAESAYPVEAARRLRLAQAAWRTGDPEGCLFHAACALASHLGGPCGGLDNIGSDHPGRGLALAGLRALDAQLVGNRALDMAVLTAAGLADFAVDVIIPPFGNPELRADELFDLIARDVPHVPLEDN